MPSACDADRGTPADWENLATIGVRHSRNHWGTIGVPLGSGIRYLRNSFDPLTPFGRNARDGRRTADRKSGLALPRHVAGPGTAVDLPGGGGECALRGIDRRSGGALRLGAARVGADGQSLPSVAADAGGKSEPVDSMAGAKLHGVVQSAGEAVGTALAGTLQVVGAELGGGGVGGARNRGQAVNLDKSFRNKRLRCTGTLRSQPSPSFKTRSISRPTQFRNWGQAGQALFDIQQNLH